MRKEKNYHGKFNVYGIGCLVKFLDKLLLVKRKNYPWELKWWTIPIGLPKEDESDEETASREVKEEVGLEIYGLTELRNEPYKTFAQDFDSSYSCKIFIAYSYNEKIRLNKNELVDAKFFYREEVDKIELAPVTKAILKDFGIEKIVLTEEELSYLIE
jgi:ADP-ribose pyrophosphatase YjhB (NUDIX family)